MITRCQCPSGNSCAPTTFSWEQTTASSTFCTSPTQRGPMWVALYLSSVSTKLCSNASPSCSTLKAWTIQHTIWARCVGSKPREAAAASGGRQRSETSCSMRRMRSKVSAPTASSGHSMPASVSRLLARSEGKVRTHCTATTGKPASSTAALVTPASASVASSKSSALPKTKRCCDAGTPQAAQMRCFTFPTSARSPTRNSHNVDPARVRTRSSTAAG
mmetsp:Transcript_57524/g.167055  ORF Transcript_57524/g.167055 Transcript_57524/m.167055 type:complete len:218 (+) Transcript_57524:711-1364(+)